MHHGTVLPPGKRTAFWSSEDCKVQSTSKFINAHAVRRSQTYTGSDTTGTPSSPARARALTPSATRRGPASSEGSPPPRARRTRLRRPAPGGGGGDGAEQPEAARGASARDPKGGSGAGGGARGRPPAGAERGGGGAGLQLRPPALRCPRPQAGSPRAGGCTGQGASAAQGGRQKPSAYQTPRPSCRIF